MKFYIYILLLIVLIAEEAVAQVDVYPISVSGNVMDADSGKPIKGATLRILKANLKITSGHNGAFLFSVNNLPDTLLATYVGYESKRMVISEESREVNIALIPVQNLIEEVKIETGYQTLKPNEVTGAIQQVDESTLQNQTGGNILQRLNNEVVGLRFDRLPENVFGNQSLDFSIRGLSTINGPLEPLIVLDGFIYEGNISNIDPNSIESVTVLKDAAATSIWGARAGNGVLVMTSKGRSPREEEMKIGFNKLITVKQKPQLNQVYQMESTDFIEIERYLFDNGFYNNAIDRTPFLALTPAIEILLKQRNGELSDAETNRQLAELAQQNGYENFSKNFLNPPFTDQYAISIQGGTTKHSYAMGGGYTADKNYNSERFDKLNLLLSNSFRPIETLTLDMSVQYTNGRNRSGKPSYNSLTFNRKSVPYLSFLDQSASPLSLNMDFRSEYMEDIYQGHYLDWRFYPLDNWKLAKSSSRLEELYSTANIRYSPLKFMDFNLGLQHQLQRSAIETLDGVESYQTRMMINQFSEIDQQTGKVVYNVPVGDIMSRDNQQSSSYTIRLQSNIRHYWGKHGITGMLGGEMREQQLRGDAMTYYGYTEDPLKSEWVDYIRSYRVIPTNGTASLRGMPTMSQRNNRFISLYSNWVYSLAQKYNLSFSVRRDGANVFGATTNDKWNPFWSLGTSWDIAKESFFDRTHVDALKLRLTYGHSGNVSLVRTPLPIGASTRAMYTNFPAMVISTLNDPSLRWESVATFNIGADFRLANDVLSGSVDFYIKDGKDLYGETSYDYTAWGKSASIIKNTARMKSKGMDFALQTKNLDGKLKWSTRYQLAWNKDRTVDYFSQFNTNLTAFIGSGGAITPIVGLPLNAISAYRWAGLNGEGQPQGFLEGKPSTDYAAIRREAVANELEQVNIIFVGSAKPEVFGSLLNNFSYKQFDLSFNISFKAGYYFRKSSTSYASLFSTGSARSDVEKRWREPGDEQFTDMPSLIYPAQQNRDSFYAQSEIHVRRGDHIRLEYVNFSWRPRVLVESRIHSQVYLNASNLGVLWRKSRDVKDPDYDNTLAPLKSFTAGVRVNF